MLLIDDEGHVRTITLDRPEAMNAFSGELFDALTEALLGAAEDTSTRVVILTGAGRAFSAGLDLSEVGKDLPPPKHGVPGLFNSLIEFPKPPLREQIRAAIDAEGRVYDELMGGPDNMEAINAFLEKREPVFSTRA